MNEADGEHALPGRLSLDDALHPVLVVGALV